MAKFIRIACEVPADAVGDVLIYLSNKGYQNLGVAVEGADAAGALRQLGRPRKNAYRRDEDEEEGGFRKKKNKVKRAAEFQIRPEASAATKYYKPRFPDLRQKVLDYINDHPDARVMTDQLAALPDFKKYSEPAIRANLSALALRGDIQRLPGIDPKHIVYQSNRKEME